MNFALKSLAAATATAMSMSPALATPVRVGGPAGNVVSMDYNGCTYAATNHGNARVRVHLGKNLFAYVNPGQTWTFRGVPGFTGSGYCISGVLGWPSAEYA